MAGQADKAPSLDDVAAFLVDNPEADNSSDAPATEAPAKADKADVKASPEGDEPDGQSPDEGDPEDSEEGDKPDEEDEDAPEKAESQPSSEKFKVTVKGEDGADQTVEVDTKELIAGYTRHADYTRKTQELGERERKAAELVDTRLKEGSDYYQQQAELAVQVVRAIGGIRSDEEMGRLAQENPSLYVAETERKRQILALVESLEGGMAAEKQQREQKAKQWAEQNRQKAWGVLGQKGINRESLVGIFDGIAEKYGVPKTRFASVDDPAVVLIMRDALAYRKTQEKVAQATQKVQKAPPLPAARQATPRQEQFNAKANRKFSSGKASVRDLGAWIAANGL